MNTETSFFCLHHSTVHSNQRVTCHLQPRKQLHTLTPINPNFKILSAVICPFPVPQHRVGTCNIYLQNWKIFSISSHLTIPHTLVP